MAIRIYKAYTPGTRTRSNSDFSELTKKKPEKALLAKKCPQVGEIIEEL
jgi:large subunit ribosomal protein L2